MGIRVVPNTGPKRVARRLQPDERQLIVVRKSLAQPLLGILPLVLALTGYALRATGTIHGSAQAQHILVILIVPCLLLAGHSIAAWLLSYVVVTTQRILIPGWWRIRHVTEIPLAAAGELSFVRTFPGRLFGYGTFRRSMPGSRWRVLKIRFLPYPEQLYLEVCGLIFHDPGYAPYGDD